MDIQLLILRALPYGVLLYGLVVAARPRPMSTRRIWLGAAGVGAIVVAVSAAFWAPTGLWSIMPGRIAAFYVLILLVPSLAVGGAAMAVRQWTIRPVLRLAAVAAAFFVTYTISVATYAIIVRDAPQIDRIDAVQ
jgi:hypothetical protein